MKNVVAVAARTGPRKIRVELYGEAALPTARGLFRTIVFREVDSGLEHVAMLMGDVAGEDVPARIHSECLTSEVLGSLKCDCRAQLDRALDFIAARRRGVLLYLRQEGRGIGLGNKIRAYALQAQGHDTYEANRLLGFPDDLRRYDVAAEMLRLLGVRSVALITNNPDKLSGLAEAGIPVKERIQLPSPANEFNIEYLRTKRERTGHLIQTDDEAREPSAEPLERPAVFRARSGRRGPGLTG
ncbi:GTP cyclohydrolase II [Anaeromyxobacter oryzisoli]|uniref:GTP cyclohydrolase II n=1 Tax=Anaeromyxobacter oryzisoli TaxID=2925408 RepID=UPI001F5A777A|nr:GTP cyclohydrolase II [Anaeromyxobacter sp. SG63]